MAERIIASPQNPYVKLIKRLRTRRGPGRLGKALVEGVRLVEEALSSGAEVEFLIRSRSFEDEFYQEWARSLGVPVLVLEDALFREVMDTETPQGLAAVCATRLLSPEHLPQGDLFVILDRVSDPGNLGTILRSSDAAAADGVVLLKGCADPHGTKALRAAMGSTFHLPLIRADRLEAVTGRLRGAGVRLLAADLEGRDVFSVDLRRPVALVIGNEAHGISPEVKGLVDEVVRIPMPGRAESLNAAVAASILLYEAIRQRTAGASL